MAGVNLDLNDDPAYAAATAANEAARAAAQLIITPSMQGYDLRVSTPAERNAQIAGSQFWMTGLFQESGQPEPTLAQKAIYSDAGVARDWVSGYVQSIVGLGVPVSTAIATKATSYPAPAQSTIDLWVANPISSPVSAILRTLDSVGIKLSTATNSPGSTNEPPNMQNPDTTQTVTGAPDGAGGATLGDPIKAVTDTLGNYGMWVLGGIICIFLVFMMFSGRRSQVEVVRA